MIEEIVLEILTKNRITIKSWKTYFQFSPTWAFSIVKKTEFLPGQNNPESIDTLPAFVPIEGHKSFDQISSQ
jgi:hypothetical protein